MTLLLLAMVACGGEPDCWYCIDSGRAPDDPPAGGELEFEVGDTWDAVLDIDLSAGELEVSRVDADGAECVLSVGFSALVEVEDCEACSVAAELTFGAPQLSVSDCASADQLAAIEGGVLAVGNGSSSLGSYQGVDYYDLQMREGGAWGEAIGGYSGLSRTSWVWGIK